MPTPLASNDFVDNPRVTFGEDLHCAKAEAKPVDEQNSDLLDEYSLEVPSFLKDGQFSIDSIREGIMLSTVSLRANEEIITNFEFEETPISIQLVLSGHSQITYHSYSKKEQELNAQQEFMYKDRNVSGAFSIQKNNLFQMVNIVISDEAIIKLLADCEQYEPLIATMLRKKEGNHVIGDFKMSSAVNIAALQIMQCPQQMVSRKIYLESKVLEILALQFEKLLPHEKPTRALNKEDVERIHAAKDILFAHTTNPPSLVELSHKVGINDFKLKQGFKKVFNNTAYGLLREYRMEKAKGLLLEGGTTVSAIADLLGYANASHFILAFKKYYTITPGEMIRCSLSRHK